jgi:hypothetical protein
MMSRLHLLVVWPGLFDEWWQESGLNYQPQPQAIVRRVAWRLAGERRTAADRLRSMRTNGAEPTEDEIDAAVLEDRRIAAGREFYCNSGTPAAIEARVAQEYSEGSLLRRAEAELKYAYALKHVEQVEARRAAREKSVLRHYAERAAGREPARPLDLVSIADAAHRVGMKPEQILYWIRKEYLRVWGVPKHYRVSLSELKECAIERNEE